MSTQLKSSMKCTTIVGYSCATNHNRQSHAHFRPNSHPSLLSVDHISPEHPILLVLTRSAQQNRLLPVADVGDHAVKQDTDKSNAHQYESTTEQLCERRVRDDMAKASRAKSDHGEVQRFDRVERGCAFETPARQVYHNARWTNRGVHLRDGQESSPSMVLSL